MYTITITPAIDATSTVTLSPNKIPTRHDKLHIFFEDSVRTHGNPVFHFCIKTMNENTEYERDWPKGSFCILKKGNCSQGLITTMH